MATVVAEEKGSDEAVVVALVFGVGEEGMNVGEVQPRMRMSCYSRNLVGRRAKMPPHAILTNSFKTPRRQILGADKSLIFKMLLTSRC